MIFVEQQDYESYIGEGELSNKSRGQQRQMPATARQPIGGGLKTIVEGLREAGERIKEQQAEAELQEQAETDLNILPLPEEQVVLDDRIVWTWRPWGEEVSVHGILFTKRVETNTELQEKGSYRVDLALAGKNKNTFSLFSDSARFIGQALISAHNYQHIWKAYAGDFMERQLMGEPEKTCSGMKVVEDDNIPAGMGPIGVPDPEFLPAPESEPFYPMADEPQPPKVERGPLQAEINSEEI